MICVKTKLQKHKPVGHGRFMIGMVDNKRHQDEFSEVFLLKWSLHVLPTLPQVA
jgi:hypothetical protein